MHLYDSTPEWDVLCQDTLAAMATFVLPFTTCIAQSDSEDTSAGVALGTGNYIRAPHSVVLTNAHVAMHYGSSVLAHLPHPGDFYVRFHQDAICDEYPVEAAIMPVEDFLESEDRRFLTGDQLDSTFCAVEGELLFWAGYPGTTGERFDLPSKNNARETLFGHLAAPAVPILSQLLPHRDTSLHPRFEPFYHVIVEYPPRALGARRGTEVNTWCPHGMSGSLLWDTKRIASRSRGEAWSTLKARVCGIVWGTQVQPDCVIATRIEHLLPLLFADSGDVVRAT